MAVPKRQREETDKAEDDTKKKLKVVVEQQEQPQSVQTFHDLKISRTDTQSHR